MERSTPWVMVGLAFAFAGWSGFAYWHPGTAPVIDQPPARASNGKQVWLSRNCQACHQVYGLGGYLGPDLTNVVPDRGVAHVRAVLKNGFRTMPKFELTDTEVDDLLIYLEYIGRTGRFPLKKWPTGGLEN
jgi:nitric oxide reductase subunit C